MGCVKIEQVMNVTKEGKRHYSRSMADKETITITIEIFYTEPPKINLLSINHTLEHLRQVEEHLQDETKKVKITSGSEKRRETCIFKKKMTALKSEVWQSNTCLILLCKVVSSGVLQNWPLHGNNGQGSLTEWFKDFNIWSFHNCILHHVKEFFTVLTLIILGMWLLKLVIQLWHKRMCIKRKLCTKL